ncbi:glycosyltransferase family 4 protein [Clostridium perfringens]|uniref:glycosyltransferase family 4 protein n=1 Tax=Clostridium perfringens TaxID=1502 RepID=UPI0037EDAD47|nr:glycosyltransferase family 4 protein [Clostridium perfringens]
MKVLMVGVGKKRVGGMLTVAEQYLTDEVFNKNVELMYVSTSTNGSIFIRFLYMIVGYIKILFILSLKKVDIIHIHMAEKGSTFRKGKVAKWGKLFGKKVIIHLHAGPFMSWYNSLNNNKKHKVREIFSYSDKVLVLGEFWKKELKQIVPEERMIVLYNGVECPINNLYNPDAKNIAYLGVMNKEKGIYDLLEAISNIESRLDKDVKILLCGNDLVGDIQSTINRLGLEKRVEMLGWINKNEQINIFKNTMISVLPSYFEGLSMTIIEAMAYGIPVVTTNISTMPEVLGDYSYLIEPGDSLSLGEYLLNLSNRKDKRIEISKNEYLRAKELFSKTNLINSTLNIYNSIIK